MSVRSKPLLWVCCCGPGGQEISINCCSNGVRIRAVPHCQVLNADLLLLMQYRLATWRSKQLTLTRWKARLSVEFGCSVMTSSVLVRSSQLTSYCSGLRLLLNSSDPSVWTSYLTMGDPVDSPGLLLVPGSSASEVAAHSWNCGSASRWSRN